MAFSISFSRPVFSLNNTISFHPSSPPSLCIFKFHHQNNNNVSKTTTGYQGLCGGVVINCSSSELGPTSSDPMNSSSSSRYPFTTTLHFACIQTRLDLFCIRI
ncbi:hypothetical protein CsSME_00002299 [Camellia sinensis var. sinensis]